jgi:molybdenum cofactor guanylyltransferase
MEDSEKTLGVILAGGLSRRMGGGDKGLAMLGGQSLLKRVVSRVQPQVDGILLSANGDPSRFADLGLPIAADASDDRPGPLAGILAGLEAAASSADAFGHVLSVPCDTPFLPADLVARLHGARRESGAPGAVAVSGGRQHSTVALWPIEGRTAISDALAKGVRRVSSLVAALGLAEAAWPVEPFDPFVNVNDPDEMRSAEALLALYSDA